MLVCPNKCSSQSRLLFSLQQHTATTYLSEGQCNAKIIFKCFYSFWPWNACASMPLLVKIHNIPCLMNALKDMICYDNLFNLLSHKNHFYNKTNIQHFDNIRGYNGGCLKHHLLFPWTYIYWYYNAIVGPKMKNLKFAILQYWGRTLLCTFQLHWDSWNTLSIPK